MTKKALRLAPVTEAGVGLRLAEVFPEGIAAKAGLQTGDVILELNGKDISQTPFDDIDVRGQAGEIALLKVRRGGVSELLTFEVVREPVPVKDS